MVVQLHAKCGARGGPDRRGDGSNGAWPRGAGGARDGLKAKQLTPAAYKAAGCPGAVVARVQAGMIAA